MRCITISHEVLDDISSKALSNKKLSWNYVERICYSFDDILLIVNHSVSIGITFTGIPDEKTEKFLKTKGINLRNL